MAEPKPVEVIMRIDFAASKGLEVVAHAEKVQELVRCKDCQYSREPNRHNRAENAACEGVLICCSGFDHVYPTSDDGLIFTDGNWFCANGERRSNNG